MQFLHPPRLFHLLASSLPPFLPPSSPHITDILPLFLSSAPSPYSSLPPSPSPSPSPAAKTLDIIESFLRRHPAFARVWRQTMVRPPSLPPSSCCFSYPMPAPEFILPSSPLLSLPPSFPLSLQASYNHEDKILPSSLPPSASSSFRATVAKSQEQARGVLEAKGQPREGGKDGGSEEGWEEGREGLSQLAGCQ